MTPADRAVGDGRPNKRTLLSAWPYGRNVARTRDRSKNIFFALSGRQLLHLSFGQRARTVALSGNCLTGGMRRSCIARLSRFAHVLTMPPGCILPGARCSEIRRAGVGKVVHKKTCDDRVSV